MRPKGATLTPFDEVRERARRAWQAARGRIEDRPGRDAPARSRMVTEPALATPGPVPPDDTLDGDAGVTPGTRPAEASVPRGVRVGAAWAWRLIVIVGAALGAFYLLRYVSGVVIPVIVALLLSALLQPGAGWLRRHGVPRSLAAAIMLITGVVVVAGVLTGVVTSFVSGFSELSDNVVAGINTIQNWLQKGPLHVSQGQLRSAVETGEDWLRKNQAKVTSGALSGAATIGQVAVDLFLILFTTFFLVRDGRGIWNFLIQLLLPRSARASVDDAGSASWRTLVAYVRATILVASIDAIGIGIGLIAVRVDTGLAIPLAALVFLGAFIPIVGALISGIAAILVTLVTQGLVQALVVTAVVLGVQQIESHLLQPLIMGRAVAIHPLAVILGITAGIGIGGIFGGLIAVPLIAVMNTAVRRLVAKQRHMSDAVPDEPPPALPPPQSGAAGPVPERNGDAKRSPDPGTDDHPRPPTPNDPPPARA